MTRPAEVDALWEELQRGPGESRGEGGGGGEGGEGGDGRGDGEALVELRKLIREREQLEELLVGVDYVVAENVLHLRARGRGEGAVS